MIVLLHGEYHCENGLGDGESFTLFVAVMLLCFLGCYIYYLYKLYHPSLCFSSRVLQSIVSPFVCIVVPYLESIFLSGFSSFSLFVLCPYVSCLVFMYSGKLVPMK